MKELDDLLKTEKATPKRELSPDFTNRIVNELVDNPRQKQSLWQRLICLLHQPIGAVAALLVMVLIVGGTAYAAPQVIKFVNAIFQSETYQPDGSRVVAISQVNCGLQEVDKSGKNIYYYRIKPDAPITNIDVTRIVQAECEYGKQQNFVTIPSKYDFGDAQVPDGSYWATSTQFDRKITEKTDNYVSFIDQMELMNGNNQVLFLDYSERKMFVNPADVQVYDPDGQTMTYEGIKAGDRVQVTYITKSTPSASLPNDDATSRVIGIQKTSVNVSKAREFSAFIGTYFNRVEPCDNGYCNIKQGSLLTPPKDYTKFKLMTDSLRSFKTAHSKYVTSGGKVSKPLIELLSTEERNRLDFTSVQSMTCYDKQVHPFSYGASGVDSNGFVYLTADQTQFAGESIPVVQVKYDPTKNKIVEYSCVSREESFDLMQKLED